VSAGGFNGDVNSFAGLSAIPGSGPNAALGYHVLKDASITAVASSVPMDAAAAPVVAAVGKVATKIPGVEAAMAKVADFANSLKGPGTPGTVTQPYGELAPGLSGTGVQAHHLNQDAAYGSLIPKDQGVSLPMPGNAITDVGSPHYDAHASMEGFWNQFREGGAREGETPTNAEVLQATNKSLQNAGVPSNTARQATQEAAAQQKQYGLQPESAVPRVPGKLNQVQPTQPTAPPNAPPVPAVKNP